MNEQRLEFHQTLSVGIPKRQEAHVVYEYELSIIENCRTQTTNSVGYTCLGAALGGVVPAIQAFAKVYNKTPIDWVDFSAIMILAGAFFVGATCIAFRYQSDHRFDNTIATVRSRTRQIVGDSAVNPVTGGVPLGEPSRSP